MDKSLSLTHLRVLIESWNEKIKISNLKGYAARRYIEYQIMKIEEVYKKLPDEYIEIIYNSLSLEKNNDKEIEER